MRGQDGAALQQLFKEVEDDEEHGRKLEAKADVVRSGYVSVEARRVCVRRDQQAATQRHFDHLKEASAGCRSSLMRAHTRTRVSVENTLLPGVNVLISTATARVRLSIQPSDSRPRKSAAAAARLLLTTCT